MHILFYAGKIFQYTSPKCRKIVPKRRKKVRQPKLTHPKTQTPIVAKQTLYSIGVEHILINGICGFTVFIK